MVNSSLEASGRKVIQLRGREVRQRNVVQFAATAATRAEREANLLAEPIEYTDLKPRLRAFG